MSSFDQDEAHSLRASGMTWDQVASALGLSPHIIRARIDPKFIEALRKKRAARADVIRAEGVPGRIVVMPRESRAADRDAERLMALIPADTRGLTARLAGDPLPGRSALDQRRNP